MFVKLVGLFVSDRLLGSGSGVAAAAASSLGIEVWMLLEVQQV